MITNAAFSKPDFVIVGVAHADGVMLFASDQLSEAELRAELTAESAASSWGVLRSEPPRGRYHLSAHTRWTGGGDDPIVAVFYGATYEEAFKRMSEEWKPPAGGSLRLAPATPELER